MSSIIRCLSVAIAVFGLNGPAFAQFTLDQRQEARAPDAPPLTIGGPSGRRLAQVFQPGANGLMTAIALPIACSSGELIIEFREPESGFPTGGLRQQMRVSADDLPDTAGDFVFIELDSPLPVGNFDDALAMVLINFTGSCELAAPVNGNSYRDGEATIGTAVSGPPFVQWEFLNGGDFANNPDDLAFRTYLRDNESVFATERCFAPGTDNVRSGYYAGSCRCFADMGQGKMRCNGSHPHFSIVREIPWPLTPGERYREVWKFTRYRKLDGTVRMRLEGADFDQTITRTFGNRARPGMIEAVAYEKVAPDVIGEYPGIARFDYNMRNADDDSFRFFGFDISIKEENFEYPD